jgi:hypothetical protein
MEWLNLRSIADNRQGTKMATKPSLKVSIAALHRMRMRKLQGQLVQQVLHMRYKTTEPKGWEYSLEKYSTFITRLSKPPFLLV